ncbi:MAG TPA: hypothetical protein PKC21_02440 [Oligoflexia bacterium]|nr:hypothetical protein [Oligoflexia bacterium]HMR24190.1 hypothetical protein [Oligoflexia bacterium]
MLFKQIVGIVGLVLFSVNIAYGQDQEQLNLKKIELLDYVKEKVSPQLDQAIKDAEDSANSRWKIFGAGAVTVGGFIAVQHQRLLKALNRKINTLLRDQQRLNLQIAQQRSNAASTINEMRVARTQARSGIVLNGVFNSEGVTVPPHRQLDELTRQLANIDEGSLHNWWDLLRQRRALETQIDILNRAGREVSTVQLDEVIGKITQLENDLFSSNQAELAVEVQKIKADSQRLQQLLKDAKANLDEANLRSAAISDEVGHLRSSIKAHNARYIRFGVVAVSSLAVLGFVGNMYWINERYKDYFGQELSAQKLSSSSSYTQKQNTIYLMAKNYIIGSNYQDCPEQDYAWVHESLRQEEKIEHVQMWISAMEAVCLQLSLMDEEACKTHNS